MRNIFRKVKKNIHETFSQPLWISLLITLPCHSNTSNFSTPTRLCLKIKHWVKQILPHKIWWS